MRFESPQRNDNFSSNETKRPEIDGVVGAVIWNQSFQATIRKSVTHNKKKKSSCQDAEEANISRIKERRSHQNYSINSNKNHQFWTFIFLFEKNFSSFNIIIIESIQSKNRTRYWHHPITDWSHNDNCYFSTRTPTWWQIQLKCSSAIRYYMYIFLSTAVDIYSNLFIWMFIWNL